VISHLGDIGEAYEPQGSRGKCEYVLLCVLGWVSARMRRFVPVVPALSQGAIKQNVERVAEFLKSGNVCVLTVS